MINKIKKMIIVILIISIIYVILQIILSNALSKNEYDSYINVQDITKNRIKYVENLLAKIDDLDFSSIYENLSKNGKEQFGNNIDDLESYINKSILLSEKITNKYMVQLYDITEQNGNVLVTYEVIIAPSDIELAKDLLGKNKVVRSIFIEVLEKGPMDFEINRIFEEEE